MASDGEDIPQDTRSALKVGEILAVTTEPIYGKQCRDEEKPGARGDGGGRQSHPSSCGKRWGFSKASWILVCGFSTAGWAQMASWDKEWPAFTAPAPERCETSLREWGWVAKAFPEFSGWD